MTNNDNEKNIVIGNIVSNVGENSLSIKSNETPFVANFYFDEIFDEKECKRFIKNVEKLIRQSREYKSYIALLRNNKQELNHDNILHNITDEDVELEFHHAPLTLYDIVEIIVTHHIANSEKMTSLSVAKEVMELHFKHKIGIVPLTRTTHELVHSGNIFISKNQIFGNYEEFINEYNDGLKFETKQKLKTFESLSASNAPSDYRGLLK